MMQKHNDFMVLRPMSTFLSFILQCQDVVSYHINSVNGFTLSFLAQMWAPEQWSPCHLPSLEEACLCTHHCVFCTITASSVPITAPSIPSLCPLCPSLQPLYHHCVHHCTLCTHHCVLCSITASSVPITAPSVLSVYPLYLSLGCEKGAPISSGCSFQEQQPTLRASRVKAPAQQKGGKRHQSHQSI